MAVSTTEGFQVSLIGARERQQADLIYRHEELWLQAATVKHGGEGCKDLAQQQAEPADEATLSYSGSG